MCCKILTEGALGIWMIVNERFQVSLSPALQAWLFKRKPISIIKKSNGQTFVSDFSCKSKTTNDNNKCCDDQRDDNLMRKRRLSCYKKCPNITQQSFCFVTESLICTIIPSKPIKGTKKFCCGAVVQSSDHSDM